MANGKSALEIATLNKKAAVVTLLSEWQPVPPEEWQSSAS